VSVSPAYHLLLDPEEVPVIRSALELLIEDAAREQQIRALARAVISRLPAAVPLSTGEEAVSVPLEPGELKIVYTAARLLLDDLQREQAEEMEILHRILGKLPDEHAIRAITLD
jgi:hypothetical protein